MRYGDKNNLTFALPKVFHYFGHPEPFHRSMVNMKPSTSSKRNESSTSILFNILAHHARFQYEQMRSIMPNDTIFVTIMRNPICLMESLFCYYHVDKRKNERCQDAIVRFFSSWPNNSVPGFLLTSRVQNRFGFNQMCYDLGMEPKDFNDTATILRFVKYISTKFNLVLILEHLEESLILLQDLLCWSLDDIIVFQLNARNEQVRCKLPIAAQDKFRQLNSADEILYEFFLNEVKQKSSDFNQLEMKRRISCLRNATQIMYNVCGKGEFPSEAFLSSVTTDCRDFTLLRDKNNDTIKRVCKYLTIPELEYTDLLKRKANQ